MSSIFSKIINREIPGYIVWENERFCAFLDIRPVNPGHLLIVPKNEIGYVFEMDDAEYTELFLVAKQLSKPLQQATDAKRIGIVIEGFSIDHVHLHLVPINNEGELDPHRAKDAVAADLEALAEKIKSAILTN